MSDPADFTERLQGQAHQLVKNREEVRDNLKSINPYKFEDFIADLWAEKGYDTEVEGGRNQDDEEENGGNQENGEEASGGPDGGIDVRARRRGPGGKTVAIQVKRYTDKSVGSPDVQQYASLREQTGADDVVIITTNDFTKYAHNRASELNVTLINGEELVKLIDRNAGLGFYATYREELGIERADLETAVINHVSITSRCRIALAGFVGKACERVGRSLRGVARLIRTTIAGLWYGTKRLRLVDPFMSGSSPPEPAVTERLHTTGTDLRDSGMRLQSASLINWQPDTDKVDVPETGIDPVLRPESRFDPRYHLAGPVVGLLLCAVAVVTQFTLTTTPSTGLLMVAAVLSSLGIILSTTFYSTTPGDVLRYVYLLPILLPTFTQDIISGGDIQLVWMGMLVTGMAGFCVHTLVSYHYQTVRYKPDGFPVSFVPVHRSGTAFGCVGFALLAGLLIGPAEYVAPLPHLDGASVAASAAPVSLTPAGALFVAVVVFPYLWRGGALALATGPLLLVTIAVIAGHSGWWNAGGVHLGVVAVLVSFWVVLGLGVLHQLEGRSFRYNSLLLTVLIFGLLDEVALDATVRSGLLALPEVPVTELLLATALVACSVFVTVLLLEYKYIQATLSESPARDG